MLTYDKNSVGKKARELGFVRDTFEKMSRLTEILQFLVKDPELTALALKGGTAINLTMLNLPRLSIDIDMDFAKNLSKDDMPTARQRRATI